MNNFGFFSFDLDFDPYHGSVIVHFYVDVNHKLSNRALMPFIIDFDHFTGPGGPKWNQK